jgi:hypothetical protein
MYIVDIYMNNRLEIEEPIEVLIEEPIEEPIEAPA